MDIKKITVWINEKFQEMLLKWATTNWLWGIQLDLSNAPKANIYLVSACTWVSEEEIREWDKDVFEDILEKVNATTIIEKKNLIV